MRKNVFFFFVILHAFHGPKTLAAEDTFRARLSEDLGSLDWGYGEVNSQVVLQLMEGLTRSGKRGEALPALADRWSRRGRIHEFHVRENAKWSDGVPVCASDFEYAWNRIKSGAVPSPFAHLFEPIKRLRTSGCGKLIVETARPLSYLPELTSHWVFFPARRDAIERLGAKWFEAGNLWTTGPYRLKEWKKDVRYSLEKNPYYHEKFPGPGKIEFLIVPDDRTALVLFQQGRLDWLKDPPVAEKKALLGSEGLRVFPSAVGYHLGFDFSGALYDRNARCAISKALDVSLIPKFLLGTEVPAHGFLPRELKGGILESRFDLARARELWKGGKHPPAIEITYYSKQIHEALMDWLQSSLSKALGTSVRLKKMEGKAYWAELSRKAPPIFLSGTTAAYAHPAAFLEEMRSGSPPNWGHYASPEYDRLVSRVVEGDGDAAILARQAEALLVQQDCAVIPLYFRPTALLLSDRWRGFFVNPMAHVHLRDIAPRQMPGEKMPIE